MAEPLTLIAAPTGQVTTHEGVLVRVWTAEDTEGNRFVLLIHRVLTAGSFDAAKHGLIPQPDEQPRPNTEP
jgi:hypothetical protein